MKDEKKVVREEPNKQDVKTGAYEINPVQKKEVETPKKEEPVIGKVIGCKKLRVRKQPNTSSQVLSEILVDSEVNIDLSKSTNDFYKVCTEAGVDGFCMKDYISIAP